MGRPRRSSRSRAYGRQAVGLAFQITDDLLDVAGNPEAVGKRLAKDAEQGKLTFPRSAGRVRPVADKRKSLSDEACAMIEVFGAKGEPLAELARHGVDAEELGGWLVWCGLFEDGATRLHLRFRKFEFSDT